MSKPPERSERLASLHNAIRVIERRLEACESSTQRYALSKKLRELTEKLRGSRRSENE